MGSRFPILPAAASAVVLLLIVLWVFGPTDEREIALTGREPAATIALLKDRAIPPRGVEAAGSRAPQGQEAGAVVAAETPTPGPRLDVREQVLERRRKQQLRQPPAAISTERGVDIESGLLEDPLGSDPPSLGRRPPVPPDSPYAGLNDDEMAELVVAMQRLRDSGALRRVDPQDYLRVMEIMPESRGLQDADRIFQEILGMSVGEWLSESRGGQIYMLE